MYSSRGNSPLTKASAPALFSACTCARFVPSLNNVEIGSSRSRSSSFSANFASVSSNSRETFESGKYDGGALGVKEGVWSGLGSNDEVVDVDSSAVGIALLDFVLLLAILF